MDTKRILLKSFAMAASASLVFSACKKEEKEGKERATNRPGEPFSPGTGYGGQGAGTGGAQDRTGTASERDTAFEESFYGPPGSDWRFTPGTGLYDFENKGTGGTGSDSSAKVNSAKADKSRKQAAHDSAKDGMPMMKDGKRMMKDSLRTMKDSGTGSY